MSNKLKSAVQAQFGATAEAYVQSAVHATGADLARMVELAGLRGDERVLDIATGGGHTALAFAPHVAVVVASDLTPDMLAAARRFVEGQGSSNVRFEQADAEDLPFGDASFDVVTCRVAAHHFADIGTFALETARVLRPGGRLLLSDTVAPEDAELDAYINAIEKLRDPTHVRDYTLSEWRDVLSAVGLHVALAEPFPKTIHFDDWCVRARVADHARAELRRRMLGASPEAREAFAIKLQGDEVESFVLPAAVVHAVKRIRD